MFKVITFLGLLVAASGQEILTDGVAVVVGGYGGGISLEVIEDGQHCLGEDAMPPLPLAPSGTLEGWVAEYVDDMIFLCGGSNINQVAECYSVPIGQGYWNLAGEMGDAREFGASLVFNGEMMIMGGYNDRQGWLSSVEKKVAGSIEWEVMSDWTLPRAMFNLCAMQKSENEIIIFGGDEYGQDYLDLVTVLNTDTGEWTEVAPLSFGRAALGCLRTEYDGMVGAMITGGCTDDCLTHVGDVAFLPFDTMEWMDLPSLNEIRMGHKMTHVNGMPTVVAGYDDQLKFGVEMFDGEKWVNHPNDMEFGRWAYGMPSYIPMDLITCGDNGEPDDTTTVATDGDGTTAPPTT